MSPIADEWVEKAEGDFSVAVSLFRLRKKPTYDAVCFHSQQCAEKYMKGILQELDVRFGKTHNLRELLDLLIPYRPLWEAYREKLRILSTHAVDFRYPGMSADKATANAALDLCKIIRKAARAELGM